MFRLRGQEKAPGEIVIVAIDDRSIEKLGRWPWSRRVMAEIVDKLSAYSPSVIVFDIIFSEKERFDETLRDSFQRAGNILLPYVFFFDQQTPNLSLDPAEALQVLHAERFRKYTPIEALGVLLPLPVFIGSASGLGFINIVPDHDGTVRSEILYINYMGYLFPSLSLKATAFHLGIPMDRVLVDATKGVYLGARFIPTDPYGRILINYYGGIYSFKHISAVDLLEGKVEAKDIEDKIVLIGATAIGIYDLRVTPVSPVLPGVEKHAHVIASLLEGKLLASISKGLYCFLLFLMGLVTSIIFGNLRGSLSVLSFLLLSSIIFLASYLFFVLQKLWISPFYLLANISLQYIAVTVTRYLLTEREARFIRRLFSSYVTERVVNELVKNPSLAKLGGELRAVSILFSDIRGFTSFSEKMLPDQVVRILNEYFSAMTEIIFKWEGTLDKFMGDAIMVFWGAPLPQPDHAYRAVRCALDMQEKLKELCTKWSTSGYEVTLRIGIGINTGEVIVGNIGAEGKKMDYTVIGDHVNLASRLESLNKKFNTEILISEFTLEKIEPMIVSGHFGPYIFRSLGKVVVKGKEKPVEVFTIYKSEDNSFGIERPSEEQVLVMTEK